jgi:hypothetical protein
VYGIAVNAAINQCNDDQLGAKKAADQAYNSTSLANDTHLLLPVAASAFYLVDWWLRLDGPAANDVKYSFTGPASATLVWSSLGALITNTVNDPAAFPDVLRFTDAPTIGTVIQHGTIAASTFQTVRGQGYLETSATAGNLQMQIAQVVAAASLTIRKGSWIKAQRVA